MKEETPEQETARKLKCIHTRTYDCREAIFKALTLLKIVRQEYPNGWFKACVEDNVTENMTHAKKLAERTGLEVDEVWPLIKYMEKYGF